MEFRQTLIAAQKNQQQKSSENLYYKARFDPPKKEQKQKDRLSANIQKFLAQKEEEERQKKLEAQRKREELLAMRDPKALRKIQKTLKVIKSANKSVIADAIDHDNTAVTREGPDQPDQDDYGYESQEAAAIYEKMMQKYSKIPDEPKFPTSKNNVKKDLNGTRERVKHALQHENDPVPHKRRRKGENYEKEPSPPSKHENEKKKDEKPDKPKFRKPAPPPMDFNQLLKLAEKKKSEPLEVAAKKVVTEPEPERLMTKKQKKEYEEEMARRQRRQERMESAKGSNRKVLKEDKPVEKEKKTDTGILGRIPKIAEKSKSDNLNSDIDRVSERDRLEKLQQEKDRARLERAEREKERLDRERLDKLKAERERIDREMERLNKDRDKLEKKLESSKPMSSKVVEKNIDRYKSREDIKNNMDLKSQNTYRIDKNNKKFVPPNKGSDSKHMNGHSSQGKPVPKLNRELPRNGEKEKIGLAKQKAIFGDGPPKLNGHVKQESKGEPSRKVDAKATSSKSQTAQVAPTKPKMSNSFDFDKHVSSLGKNGQRPMDKNLKKPNGTRQLPPSDFRKKPHPDEVRRIKMKRRAVDSDSEYDSEMDDFIDDSEENQDYSRHIQEIFGYDKSKYRYLDDDDDPTMESTFAQQQREEYISKKIGIMEDLEDMRMEAMEKKKMKKKRRISDD